MNFLATDSAISSNHEPAQMYETMNGCWKFLQRSLRKNGSAP